MSANSSTTSSKAGFRGARSYVAWFFAISALLIALAYGVRFTYLADIAPQFTGNASLDQKLLFIRNGDFGGKPLALVVGSSMALNNIDADLLQKAEGIRAINAGVWDIGLKQSVDLAAQLSDLYDVRELTLVVQFFEMTDERNTSGTVAADDLRSYLARDLWMDVERPFDIAGALSTKWDWNGDYGNPNSYMYLKFTETGSVPLPLDRAHIDRERWSPSQRFSSHCDGCLLPIVRICEAAVKRHVPFTVVMPPLTHFYRADRPDAARLYERRRRELAAMVSGCGGRLFDVERYADFDDACFVDFSHLSSRGVRSMTDLLIAWKRGLPASPRRHVRCD